MTKMADERFDLFLNDLESALERWGAERALKYAIQCNRATYVMTGNKTVNEQKTEPMPRTGPDAAWPSQDTPEWQKMRDE